MQITLTVMAGPHKGRVFTFDGHENFLVGRSKRATFRLPVKDKYFSRIHFMVEVNPPYARLMDIGSTNGTYVNKRRVKRIDLKDGDRIHAGRTTLRVALQGAEGTPIPKTGPPVPQQLPPTPPAPAPLPEKGTPFGTLKPFQMSGSPASRHGPGSVSGPCPVCGGAVPSVESALSEEEFRSSLPSLCATCREEIRKQPQPITGYQIVRELGRGSMGIVYLALRLADGTPVALKTITPAVPASQADVDRFFREASILRQLNHAHIVGFREFGSCKDRLYFAMDYVRGTDAFQLLKSCGPLPIPRAVALVCQLLEALEYAHAKSFVHRDIKPANLLVTQRDGREVVQLADFGLARVYQASRLSGLTVIGDVGGTLAFMAPEQITHFREVKPPADQYAAGATLYNLLTDRFIYDLPRSFEQQLLMILQGNPLPIQSRRPDIPKGLADVIHRALARAPEARHADVQTMRQALVRFCEA